MNDMEQKFRNHLARVPAPPGFAERVAARVERRKSVFHVPGWLAIAAALLIMASLGIGIYEHRRASQAEEAKEQLIRALEITASTLERTRTKILKRTRGNI